MTKETTKQIASAAGQLLAKAETLDDALYHIIRAQESLLDDLKKLQAYLPDIKKVAASALAQREGDDA